MSGEAFERPAARERQRRTGGVEGVVVLRLVGDVLARPSCPAPRRLITVVDLTQPETVGESRRASRNPQPRVGDETVRPSCSCAAAGAAAVLALQACHQLVEAQLLEVAADGVELAGAVLDQRAALANQLERLSQSGLPESRRRTISSTRADALS